MTEVTMPSMGADMTEGAVAKWLKKEGDPVKRGDILAEIETDKAVVEMEAYGAGVLRKIVIPEGQKVPVGQLIAYIGEPADKLPEAPGAAPAAAKKAEPAERPPAVAAEAAPARAEAGRAEPAAAPVESAERMKASPVARKLADQHGIDLSTVKGTGPGGRITRDDVERAVAAGPAPEAAPVTAEAGPGAPARPSVAAVGEITQLTSMRQAIARVTARSKTQIPHFYVTASIDMTEAMKIRKQLNEALEAEGVRISVNDFVLKASALALKKYPKFNSFFDGDKLVNHQKVNIGVAIALEAGLIVPAVLGCESKTLKEIAVSSRALGEKARSGKLTQEELTGATFSTSNLGMFEVDQFVAIIVPPQSGILAIGKVTRTPVVRDDKIVIAEIMKATVSIDHRVADGAEAAVFLVAVKKALENPVSLFV
ncbi:MAG: 2-oxo acid dehydrogenase subunit E2 [Chloroflexi bacterium]|nr:2-oxo acid dehydrogenase subunit E2 [Chloroflexota bacterium]